MDLGSIFLILALLTLVGLFISRPFFEQKTRSRNSHTTPEEQKYSALMAEHDRVLNALAELDFDYTVGKIPEEDYPAQRLSLLKGGAEVLRALDEYQPTDSVPLETAEARIEAAIAARRATLRPALSASGAAGDQPAADDDIEVNIANRRRARQEKSAGFCPQCGGPVQKSDRFCPKCGAALK